MPSTGMNRRQFLATLAGATVMLACDKHLPQRPRIGLALGGGGARGVAHILMLEVLDELGITPHRIAGTSIGAVFGAMYAAGLSGQALHRLIDRMTGATDRSWIRALFDKDIWRWLEFLEPTAARGGLIDPQAFIDFLHEQIGTADFAGLKLPLQVVATDFWKREQVIFDSGDLLTAIRASMAVPGLFPPVSYEGRLLVDGGLVNPVPYDLLMADCDLTIAIDVLGERVPDGDGPPSTAEVTFTSFQIMQAAIMRQKLSRQAPDIYIRPQIENVRVLEFYQAQQIFAQSRPAQAQLRRRLQRLL